MAVANHSFGQLAWNASRAEDQRFRKIAATILAMFVLVGIVIPWISLPELDRKEAKAVPQRFAKLILERKQEVKPEPKKPALTEAQKEALRKAEEERLRKLEEERKRLEEERRKAELERQKQLEEERRKAELERQKQSEEERRRAELERQKRLEEEKRRAELERQKRLEEQKRQAELERKRQQEEERRQAELERQRQEEEARRQVELERQRREAEQKRIAQEKAKGEALAADLFGDIADVSSSAPATTNPSGGPLISGNTAEAPAAANSGPDLIASRTRNATRGSGGISSEQLAAVNVGGGAALDGRSTTVVDAPVITLGSSDGPPPSTSNSANNRSEREVWEVFERTRGAVTRLYTRHLRQDPGASGKIVVEVTILPSGKVSSVRVLSSAIDAPALLDDILARIRQLDFGPKDVGNVVASYTYDFVPP